MDAFSHGVGRVGLCPSSANCRPKGNEQQNDKMKCPGHPHIERRVEGFGPLLRSARSRFADLSRGKEKRARKNCKQNRPQKDSKHDKSPMDSIIRK
jgi:hypothetical protein